jgi:transcriptional regulator
MYLPSHFQESRVDVMHALIRAYPLGTLVAMTSGGLDANHVPFLVDALPGSNGSLRCHVAKANPIWRELSAKSEVLVIFQGADAYISPSAYQAKKDNGKVVPTWDYAVVHAYGVPRVTTDRDWLFQLVHDLTQTNEAARSDPWKVSDAPADYTEKLLGAIVGIEIPIARLIGKWKVSQNRSAADRIGVVDDLKRATCEDAQAMAALIERTL